MMVLQGCVEDWPLVATALLAVLFIADTVRSWHRLRHFKGPWVASFSSLWIGYVQTSGRMYEKYAEVSRKYGQADQVVVLGPYARIGPNTLLTNDLQLLRSMSAARSPYRRSNYYAGLQMDSRGDSILSMTNTAEHEDLRAKMASAFAGKENDALEQDIDAQILVLVALLRREYMSNNTCTKIADLGDILLYFAMDAITKIAYGEAFGYLKNNEDVYDYLATFRRAARMITVATDVPALRRYHRFMMKYFSPSIRDKTGLGKMMAVGSRIVTHRYRSGDDRRDMLGSMKRHGLSQVQAEIETITTILAGAETTSTAIRAGMLYLMTAPVVLMKLRHELDKAGFIDQPDDKCISKVDSDKLPYLQACIKEILRMNPPFAGLLEKEVPEGGVYIDGHFVPGGTGVAHSTFSLQKSSQIFGEDSDIFRPERWLEASADRVKVMNDAVDMVFGYGRWGCIGRPIAYVELGKIFVEYMKLFRRFDFSIANPRDPWRLHCRNLFFIDQFWVRVTERYNSNLEDGLK